MRLRRALYGEGPTDRPDGPDGAEVTASRERSRRGATRVLWPVLVSVVFVGVLFVAVFPTQTYLNQNAEAESRQAELAEIEAGNEALRARVEALRDDAAIELLARQEWGLVHPGEEAYTIVGLEPPVPVPDTWPFGGLAEQLRR